jgi:hypothetical protein
MTPGKENPMSDKPEEIERQVGDMIAAFRTELGWLGPDGEAHPRRIFLAALREGVVNRDRKARDFALAIQERLFVPEAGEDLDPADRQRCLIAVLTTRPERFPLALHIFLGLLEGIPIAEIRSIFFLVGAYCGVPGMVSGIDLYVDVLEILHQELGTRTGASGKQALERIFARLLHDYSLMPPAEQLVRALMTTTQLSQAEVLTLLARAHAYAKTQPA